jgi:hypothetical protein
MAPSNLATPKIAIMYVGKPIDSNDFINSGLLLKYIKALMPIPAAINPVNNPISFHNDLFLFDESKVEHTWFLIVMRFLLETGFLGETNRPLALLMDEICAYERSAASACSK